MRTAVSRQQRQWIISALLIALFVRALIPTGFMPAMDRPLSFQICPDGYPAQLLRQGMPDAHAHAHHHHAGAEHVAQLAMTGAEATAGAPGEAGALDAPGAPGEPSHFTHSHHGIASGEHCVFAAVAAVGSFTFNSVFVSFTIETSTREIPYVSPAIARERFVLPPSRGPPALS